jgi:glucose/mannose transport system substrate-binding protein
VSLLVVSLLAGLSMCFVGGARQNQLEVYSWWTGPGEEEGLAAMAKAFEVDNPGIRFVNAAVSGGAGSNAKAILASRLLANDPPDSYQRHAGLELLDDVRSGKVQDVTSLYDEQRWRDVIPRGLLDNLTIGGKIYAVPVNIHRANLMWFLPKTLRDLGLSGPPKNWSEVLSQAEIIKRAGKVPLAVGPGWTQKHLLETVLLGELGPDRYEKLFAGQLRWTSSDVSAALAAFG